MYSTQTVQSVETVQQRSEMPCRYHDHSELTHYLPSRYLLTNNSTCFLHVQQNICSVYEYKWYVYGILIVRQGEEGGH